jgi:plasmid stabilization system protein ParE
MILSIHLLPEAEQDLLEAANWYEEQQKGLGHQFLDAILVLFSVITETPQAYPYVYRNTQRALMHRFPFGIYYRIEKSKINVVAIMHGNRNPHRWKKRSL